MRDDAGQTLEGDFYAVQSILAERQEHGATLVLLKWVGYEKPEWVKEEDIFPGDLHRLRSEKAARERKKQGRFGHKGNKK